MRFFLFFCSLIFFTKIAYSQANKDSLLNYVKYLSELNYPRNARHLQSLHQAAEYIKFHFEKNTNRVFSQRFEYNHSNFRNIIASVGPDTGARIIVGASYDVVGETPGADANASGIAALIELSRLLGKIKNLPYRIDFVAYTLGVNHIQEMQYSGSYIHAKSLKENNIKVLGMVNLYGVGYYSEQKKSQHYPSFTNRIFLSKKGNFISIYQYPQSGLFPNVFRNLCKQYAQNIKLVTFKPLVKKKKLSKGDQENYAKMGFSAVKISNTNQYRNSYLQTVEDTYKTLDYQRICAVVNMLNETLKRYKQ